MASGISGIHYYGTGLALGTIPIGKDGVLHLRREPGAQIWTATIYISHLRNIPQALSFKGSRIENLNYILEGTDPEQLVEIIRSIAK